MNRIKKAAVFILFALMVLPQARACEACKSNQPKVLQNITHGTGPQGDTDYIIIWSAVVIVAVTLFLSIKFLVKPKENGTEHIKNIVTENS